MHIVKERVIILSKKQYNKFKKDKNFIKIPNPLIKQEERKK